MVRIHLALFGEVGGDLAEILSSWLAHHKPLHCWLLDAVDTQGQRTHSCTHKAIPVVDKFYGLSVQRKGCLIALLLHTSCLVWGYT